MGDLSVHFSRHEFKCQCGCGQDTVDTELITVLEEIHDWAQNTIRINSGNRCIPRNHMEQGSANSQHLLGRAADIHVTGVPAEEVQAFFRERWPQKYGLGSYNNFTHVDTRKGKARWTG